jgi:hypothetical protein
MRAQIKTLERAIALIGRSELAEALGVWWSDIQRWSRGEARMPRPLLDRTAALIMQKYQALPWTGAEAGDAVR